MSMFFVNLIVMSIRTKTICKGKKIGVILSRIAINNLEIFRKICNASVFPENQDFTEPTFNCIINAVNNECIWRLFSNLLGISI